MNSPDMYQQTFTSVVGRSDTLSSSKAEAKEVSDWIIVKGGVRNLSDIEFLQVVGDREELEKYRGIEEQKDKMRFIGNTVSISGIIYMLLASSTSNSSAVLSGGIATAFGFFINAFNSSPKHYIQPDYAQEKIDQYNFKLKKSLNLPYNLN